MSSARKATTTAARRNPPRGARPPRAVTGAPQRVRTSPHGDQTGGSQADSHEAADLSDEGSLDGDATGAEYGQFAGSGAALGDGPHPELQAHAPPTATLDGEAEATVLRVQERIDHELALQNEQDHPGDARGRDHRGHTPVVGPGGPAHHASVRDGQRTLPLPPEQS